MHLQKSFFPAPTTPPLCIYLDILSNSFKFLAPIHFHSRPLNQFQSAAEFPLPGGVAQAQTAPKPQ